MTLYQATTRGILIKVTPAFLPNQSDASTNNYVWAYTVEIENSAPIPVQLTARRWEITDANGITRIVEGAGVVGEQPILHQGDRFSYTSGCPLSTPSGLMCGTYRMKTLDGEIFDAIVPAFSLDSPFDKGVIN